MSLPTKSEIRKDPIVDQYVIIAPVRARRPRKGAQQTCGFCPQQADRVRALLTLGPKKRNWRIKVIQNIFPAVSPTNPRAYGVQEVVIETPNHARQLEDLPLSHIADLLRAYALRTRAITKNKKIEYVLIFKNSGGSAGASMSHSHSQVFATSFIPPKILHRSQRAQSHRMRTGRCAYCDMIQFEERSSRRIFSTPLVSAFAPFASPNNYEAWILPRRHIDNITQLTGAERFAIASALRKIIRVIGTLKLPYNYYFHQVVNDPDQHLYVKIRPRGSVWAGVEIGSGVILNAVLPEAAAAYYRAHAK